MSYKFLCMFQVVFVVRGQIGQTINHNNFDTMRTDTPKPLIIRDDVTQKPPPQDFQVILSDTRPLPPQPQYGAPAMSYPANFPTDIAGGGYTGGITGGGYSGGFPTGGGYTGGGYTYNNPTVGPTVGPSVQHIHRHIYVYGPPEGDEINIRKQVVSPGPAQKHYKIIFIKAPSYQTNTQAYLNLAKPPEHKTLVYVLVKKPEEPGDIQVNTPAPTQPSKPEVYFIKYKTKQQTPNVKPEYGVPGWNSGKK